MNNHEAAVELIRAVTSAIARGTKHYALDGTLLETPRAVIEALTRDGEIRLVPPEC